MMRSITPFLSIIIAVLLFVFFTKPLYSEIRLLQNEISQYKIATTKYSEFNAQIQNLLSIKNNRAASEKERLDLLVPNAIDSTRLLVDLEGIAEGHNLLFGNVSTKGSDVAPTSAGAPEKKDTSTELKTADISFEVIGTYTQFKDFLSDLESSVVLFEVTKITVTAIDGLFQQFAVTVRTYALPK